MLQHEPNHELYLQPSLKASSCTRYALKIIDFSLLQLLYTTQDSFHALQNAHVVLIRKQSNLRML